jgi:phosphonate transport system permease protein
MKKRTIVAAFVMDVGLGAYLAGALYRVIVPTLVDVTLPPSTSTDAVILSIIGVALALVGVMKGASLSRSFLQGRFPEGTAGRVVKHLGWFAFSVSVMAGWIITEVSPMEFFSSKGLDGAARIFTALATPNFDIIGEALEAMVVTIFTALMATIVAVPLAFVVSFAAARNVMSASNTERSIYSAVRAFLNIARSMEPIIWAIIFSVWVGIGPFAGMLALVVHTIASLAKLYSEQIEDVDDGPIEAISATGASRIQVLWFAIVPQCVLPFLSYTIYRWDINVRMATIIGFVGGGGIGTLLTQYQGLSKFHEVGTLVIIITAVVWLLDISSARIREALK